MAVYQDPGAVCAVLFSVDIRNKMSPPLPHGFVGNAVTAASARATVKDIAGKPFSLRTHFCVGLRTTDEYLRSLVDWLEVHKGNVPAVQNGGFFLYVLVEAAVPRGGHRVGEASLHWTTVVCRSGFLEWEAMEKFLAFCYDV